MGILCQTFDWIVELKNFHVNVCVCVKEREREREKEIRCLSKKNKKRNITYYGVLALKRDRARKELLD